MTNGQQRLLSLLLLLATEDQAREALRQSTLSTEAAAHLTMDAQRFLGTAEFVATRLHDDDSLEWSPAVIGLCKALEIELVVRLVQPLRSHAAQRDLSLDLDDPHLGRLARYCAGKTDHPPEMGTVAHALRTVARSASRTNSQIAVVLRELRAGWPHSAWLTHPDGLPAALDHLVRNYRNRAAHIDALGSQDYEECWEAVTGSGGLLWRLVDATRK